jgi:hypothetical protein
MKKYEPRAKTNHFLACIIDEKMKIKKPEINQ